MKLSYLFYTSISIITICSILTPMLKPVYAEEIKDPTKIETLKLILPMNPPLILGLVYNSDSNIIAKNNWSAVNNWYAKDTQAGENLDIELFIHPSLRIPKYEFSTEWITKMIYFRKL